MHIETIRSLAATDKLNRSHDELRPSHPFKKYDALIPNFSRF